MERVFMLKSLYQKTLNLAASPYAVWFLGIISFIESSFFPIPPDVILIPMVLARPNKWLLYASVTTVTSVVGGLFGYYIGMEFFDTLALPFLNKFGYITKFESLKIFYDQWGEWFVFFAGITPFPYKIVTILSGSMGFDILMFMISSICARGIRFFAVSFLVKKYGESVMGFIEKRMGLYLTIFCVVVFAVYFLIKFV